MVKKKISTTAMTADKRPNGQRGRRTGAGQHPHLRQR
jgi:hypothetical protein